MFWLLLVYVPIAHWVWGGGFLGSYGMIDFAGGLVVHLNAGIAGLVAALWSASGAATAAKICRRTISRWR